MTSETLFEAITQVKDELVDEAAGAKPAGRRGNWLKFGAAAAALAVVAGLGAGALWGQPGSGQNPPGFGRGTPGHPSAMFPPTTGSPPTAGRADRAMRRAACSPPTPGRCSP